MSIGVYFLNAILCLLCGGLDIFMAVTNYKKGNILGPVHGLLHG